MESATRVRRIDDYILGPMLGKGAFGHVRVATRVGDTTPNYAIKYMKVGKPYPKEHILQMLQQELVMQKLDHPNVLRIYGVGADGTYEKLAQDSAKTSVVYAVFQLARSGDLFDFIIGSGELSERVARWYFWQLLGAVEYLHSLGVAHRDIKPENVLLDLNYCPLLTDFGLCAKLSEVGFLSQSKSSRVGTEKCMSPELYAGLVHSPAKDDLFALGYMLFMIVARCPPFTVASVANERFKLLKENRVLEYWKYMDPKNPSKWSSDLKHLLTLMLAVDMTVRPSIAEIRAHPWMRGELPSQSEILSEFQQRQQEAIKFQRKQAEERRLRKLKQREDEKAGKSPEGRKKIGPHILRRSLDLEESIAPEKPQKALRSFDEVRRYKSTVLMSQESAGCIEKELMSLFSLAKSVAVSKKKYKVCLELTVDRCKLRKWASNKIRDIQIR